MSRAAPDGEPSRELLGDAQRRLALPSTWWLRILVTLERDFGRVPVFVDARGTPRVFVVGDEDRIGVMFATVPETVLASMRGRRACEVVGHPAFAPGSRNGGRLIVEAVTVAARDEPARALVLTFDLPLDVTGTCWMDELLRRDPQNGMPESATRSVPGGCAR